MATRRIIIGMIVLILLGGITTALFRYAGGIQGSPEEQNRTTQPMAYHAPVFDLSADGFIISERA